MYIRSNNQGGNFARNLGVSISNGEFITFLDDDDEYFPDKISLQFEYFKNRYKDKPCVIYGGLKTISSDFSSSSNYLPKYQGNVHNLFLVYNFASMITLFLPRKSFLEVGGLNNNLVAGQEWDLNIRLSENYPYYVIKKPIVRVYRHQTNRDVVLGQEKYQKILLEIRNSYKSHWTLMTYLLYFIKISIDRIKAIMI